MATSILSAAIGGRSHDFTVFVVLDATTYTVVAMDRSFTSERIGVVWVALDPQSGVLYVCKEFHSCDSDPSAAAREIRKRGGVDSPRDGPLG